MDIPDPQVWLPTALAVRLGTVALTLGLSRSPRACRWAAFGGSLTASLITGVLGAVVVWSGVSRAGVLLTHGASGFVLSYALDGLSGWFLVVLAVLSVPIALYSVGYFAHGLARGRTAFVGIAFNLLLGAVELVLAADGVIGFLFAWELMTLATAALVATEHEKRQSRNAGYLYLVMSHVGTGCLLAGFLVLASGTGSFAFRDILAGQLPAGRLRDWLFLLFLAGFGVKAGMIPFHVWLPEAHPAAPSAISALMSGVLIKTGIYAILRVCVLGLGVPSLAWGGLVLGLGTVCMLLGVLYALMQHDLKRLLAYHSIENIGIILVAVGVGMVALSTGHPELAVLGLAAGLFHVLNHALFKGLLFLGAGGVVAATGTQQIEEMGGLVKRMPQTAIFFLIGAAAISGLPFLNGFVSEWLVFQSLLFGFHSSAETLVRVAFPIGGALLGLTSALAAACFVKAFGITFLALPRSPAASAARESSWLMLAPQAFLASLCVILGLAPGPVFARLTAVASRLVGVRPEPQMVRGIFLIAPGAGSFDWLGLPAVAVAIVCALGVAVVLGRRAAHVPRAAPTWGCGGTLSSQNEYTATAFSKPLMMIFSAIYRPTREVSTLEATPYYATEVRYRAEVEPTFERFVYRPLARAVLGVAAQLRVIQAGSLHAYLAYVMALVLGLILLLWWKG